MNESLFRLRSGILVVLLIFILSIFIIPIIPGNQLGVVFGSGENTKGGHLTVAFLDVGQGDAIYIETPDGIQMLIDGGPDSSILREISRQMSFWDRRLDVILATHPDKDHIGGLVDVLNRYEVDNIIRTENDSDTAVASAFIFSSDEERSALRIVKAGEVIVLGASTTLTIYSPEGDVSNWESNTSSIVVKLQYGEIEFMLTGDAPSGIEDYLADTYGAALESEVLKLGHHGSKTSTSELFLSKVMPKYAVVSAGKDNRYGHPHTEVMNRVESQGIEVLSTAELGAIVFKSDGKSVWVE